MVVELKEPLLVQQITQLARTQERPPEDVVETAVRSYLESLEEHAIHRETEAFWKQHDQLLVLYPNQYVALRNGVVVDHDSDVSCLERRVRDRYGMAPVLIAPVTSVGRRGFRWRGGRIDRTGEIA
ncbi:MAG: hypothetical protein WA040_05765 [Anaerolineae bacterium]